MRQALKPPLAEARPHAFSIHGEERRDDFYWLRHRDDQAVTAYLEAENAHTEAFMKNTQALRESLYSEMLSRIKQTDISAPVRWSGYLYYYRTEEGKQYRIYCRRRPGAEEEEEVLVDENLLAEGHEYFRLGTFEPSPDHNLLVYSTDFDGDEVYTLVVKDLRTGQLTQDRLENTYYSVVWANDNQTIFYSFLDAAKRPYRLYRHRLGTPQEDDTLVYEEEDEAFRVWATRTNSRRFLLLELSSNTTSEIRFLDLDEPSGELRTIEPRRHLVEYYVTHQANRFLIRTNDEAPNFRLMEAPLEKPSKENWTEVLGHREWVKIEHVDAFEDFLAVFERDRGLGGVLIVDTKTGHQHRIDFPESAYTVRTGSNPEHDTKLLRLWYSSLVTPASDYDCDMETGSLTLVKQEEVLGGFDSADYLTERIWAKAPDGVEVPISIAYRKPFERNGTRPIFMYGYGSYGSSSDPYFVSSRLAYLDRGFVWAVAHVRGGGDLGERWKEDGKLLKKINTFSDFIACADHLLAEGYGAKEKLVIQGGSAGGLLIGAVLNMRPDLPKVAIADVPFVDVINTMLDESIPLTLQEYEEWGNPNEKDFYDYMKTYSPYDNVHPTSYPDILVTAGLNDPRVQYWEPAKWVAKLRRCNKGDSAILLKTFMGAGHAGPSGRYDYLEELAFKAAFVLDRLGTLTEAEGRE